MLRIALSWHSKMTPRMWLESYKSISSWEELGPNLQDHVNIIILVLLRRHLAQFNTQSKSAHHSFEAIEIFEAYKKKSWLLSWNWVLNGQGCVSFAETRASGHFSPINFHPKRATNYERPVGRSTRFLHSSAQLLVSFLWLPEPVRPKRATNCCFRIHSNVKDYPTPQPDELLLFLEQQHISSQKEVIAKHKSRQE